MLQQLWDRFRAFDPHKFVVQASIEIRQPVGFESHFMEDGCVQMLDMQRFGNCCTAELIGFSNTGSPWHTTARHPHCESIGIMVATCTLGIFGGWLAPKFPTPHHQGFVE